LFPSFDHEDQNDSLVEEIFKEELKDVLSSFQKDKKLGLEGFPIKFYPGSYDLIEEDILGVVEESRVPS